ncbi:MAG TPA: 16S rRNA (cytidine(1402)-2'-O)-methyltransferase [Bacillales bacterium]|nr:16S rRNA (cytidine(1402)-2'-O)-methyltransferase [Bacillales bacterium]
MRVQQSYRDETKGGVLYLVPTPIGNLEDMTYRAVRLLRESDLIAAEDTRNTKRLCRHFDVATPLVSYHEHNKEQSGKQLLKELHAGKTIALVSDAGMPAISDPGRELVRACIDENLFVIPLPGPNAALPALVASGFDTGRFHFYGFLPRGKKEKKAELASLKEIRETLIFYEAPHRLKETISEMKASFGDREICIGRELTKAFEEWIRGSLKEVAEWLEDRTVKGELSIVVEGNPNKEVEERAWWAELSLMEHVRYFVEIRNLPKKEAIKKTAAERGLPKREVYNAYHAGE